MAHAHCAGTLYVKISESRVRGRGTGMNRFWSRLISIFEGPNLEDAMAHEHCAGTFKVELNKSSVMSRVKGRIMVWVRQISFFEDTTWQTPWRTNTAQVGYGLGLGLGLV